jgi:phage terminase Nu1 subunit (DNA packaging protein)
MIDQSLLDNVNKKLLSNIVAKVKDGKSLTAQESSFLESQSQDVSPDRLGDDSIIKTSELVDLFGVTAQQIANLAKDQVILKVSNGRYKSWQSIKNYIRLLQKNRKSKHGSSASMDDLRKKLTEEQGRKEAAVASLRELELKMKAESLIPESEAAEKVIKLLTPLRRLLDGLPREIATMANPENPQIAELAIRNGLDDRVFSEIEKIFSDG